MASSDPELKDGFNLPMWMKTKPTTTKDFELFAASPPPAEDSFFFIRYPKKETLIGQKLEQELPSLIKQNTTDLPSATYNGRDKDWSRHTKPCQEVIHGIAPINTAVNSATSKPKSAGTDDGFKGEGAACGTSVVKVANAMVSRGSVGRGFAIASPNDETPSAHYLAARRGSRSLPASPPGSPNSRRKNNNRYFTSPFEPVGDGSGRSWLTMALLGFKKDLTTSTSTLTEEDGIEDRLHGTLAQSVESLGPAPRSKDPSLISDQSPPTQQPKLAKPAQAFRPKPTELREMNFWSPTSM